MRLPLLLRWVCQVAGVLRNDLHTMVLQDMVQNDLRPTPQPQHLSPRLQTRLLQCLVSAGEVICVVVCVNCNGESVGVRIHAPTHTLSPRILHDCDNTHALTVTHHDDNLRTHPLSLPPSLSLSLPVSLRISPKNTHFDIFTRYVCVCLCV